MRTRDNISKELKLAAPNVGVKTCKSCIRDLQAYRDAAQQGSVVFRMKRKGLAAATEMDALFRELIGRQLNKSKQTKTARRVANG